MTEFRTLLEGAAEDSWTLLSDNNPIDVALARTKANFDDDGNTFTDDSVVSSTMGTSQGNLSAFSGSAIDPENLRVIFTGGGHADSGDSSLFGFDVGAAAASLNAATGKTDWELKKKSARWRLDANGYPAWSYQFQNASHAAHENVDGERMWNACHTYSYLIYVGGGQFDIGGTASYRSASQGNGLDRMGGVWNYDWGTDTVSQYHSDKTLWSGSYVYTDNGWGVLGGSPFAYHNGKVYTWSAVNMPFSARMFRWDRATKDRDGEGNAGNDYIGANSLNAVARQRPLIFPDPGDSSKRVFWQHDGTTYRVARDIERTDALVTMESRTYATAPSFTDSVINEYSGYTYDSERNVIARWGGDGRVYHCTLESDFDSWDWSEHSTTATGDVPTIDSAGTEYIYGGFEYIPGDDAYIAVDGQKNVYVYKPNNWNPSVTPVSDKVTRLGLYGGPRSLYGSFAGKDDSAGGAVQLTRLGAYGGPRGLYGSFAGKSAASGGGHNGRFTRLGLYGGPRGLHGSFAGKSEESPANPIVTTGGGGHRRRPNERVVWHDEWLAAQEELTAFKELPDMGQKIIAAQAIQAVEESTSDAPAVINAKEALEEYNSASEALANIEELNILLMGYFVLKSRQREEDDIAAMLMLGII